MALSFGDEVTCVGLFDVATTVLGNLLSRLRRRLDQICHSFGFSALDSEPEYERKKGSRGSAVMGVLSI
jgi:hypothetical protein